MKGVTLARDTIVKVVLLIVVLFIIIWFVYFYIIRHYLPGYTIESRIVQLCPEWVEKGCTEDSALPPGGLMIEDDGNKYLSQLCSQFFTGNEESWSYEIYTKCKKKCIGCP